MTNRFCFECDKPAIHEHHVVPRVRGGKRTVPLCIECHSLVHGRRCQHPELVKEGIRKYIEKGNSFGRPKRVYDEAAIFELRSKGISIRKIGKTLGIPQTTIHRILRSR